MSLIRLEVGGFYRFGVQGGPRPVDVWVGRIDEPADLGHKVVQPVVSLVVTSMRPGMPLIGIAPFYLSALYGEGVAAINAFPMKVIDFAQNYADWRASWEAGEAAIWNKGPSEVYAEVIRQMAESTTQIRRPQ
jgi:hypothetical protein